MSESVKKAEIVKATTADDFHAIEKRDEAQILKEIQGIKMLDEFVYSFQSGGRKVTGLSWAGVKETARRMGSVQVIDLVISDMGDFWMAKAKAIDLETNLAVYGVSTQSKLMKRKTGEMVTDEFAVQKCVSKAQRNAIRSIIPEKFIAEMLEAKRTKRPQQYTPNTPKTTNVERDTEKSPSTLPTSTDKEKVKAEDNNVLDYKRGKPFKIIMEVLEKGGKANEELKGILQAQGLSIDAIATTLDLMLKEGLIAVKGTTFFLV